MGDSNERASDRVPPTQRMPGEPSTPPSPPVGDTLQSAPAYVPTSPTGVTVASAVLRMPAPCFVTLRGEVLEHALPTRIRVRYPVDLAWTNPYGILQGGFVAAMMDNVVGLCAHAHDPSRQTSTIEMSVRFFKPIHAGNVIVDGTILRAGRTTISIECVAWDDGSAMCAKLAATNLYLG
jgi:uncharacterized protein (TIGR00369 family)